MDRLGVHPSEIWPSRYVSLYFFREDLLRLPVFPRVWGAVSIRLSSAPPPILAPGLGLTVSSCSAFIPNGLKLSGQVNRWSAGL
ncbi:helix-turn-helix domain-containing protein [Photorhabdus sp. UCH-936]|nr:helix-turn-helix domain-containing protein [Photorhabdus antumapuensis]